MGVHRQAAAGARVGRGHAPARLPRAGRLYLTTVEADVAGDTVMPEFDPKDWREIASESFPADARHRYPFRCAVYERAEKRTKTTDERQ